MAAPAAGAETALIAKQADGYGKVAFRLEKHKDPYCDIADNTVCWSVGVDGEWTKVKTTLGGTTYTGWIKTRNLAPHGGGKGAAPAPGKAGAPPIGGTAKGPIPPPKKKEQPAPPPIGGKGKGGGGKGGGAPATPCMCTLRQADGYEGVALRAEPGDAAPLLDIRNGTAVNVLSFTGEWARVELPHFAQVEVGMSVGWVKARNVLETGKGKGAAAAAGAAPVKVAVSAAGKGAGTAAGGYSGAAAHKKAGVAGDAGMSDWDDRSKRRGKSDPEQSVGSKAGSGMDCSEKATASRMARIDGVDKRLVDMEQRKGKVKGKAISDLVRTEDIEPILQVYRDIRATFQHREFKAKYGYKQHADMHLCMLQEKEPVPEYYANVDQGQSIWHRKMLSIAGLCNLIIYGAQIFGEMQDKHFSCRPGDYGQHDGPAKMKRYTGNAVDLDTVVLRCSDTACLKMINQQNKKDGVPEHKSADAFGESQQARDIAMTTAAPLIEQFCKDMSLKGKDRERRRLDFDPKKFRIARAYHSKDRGDSALWQYINAGVNSFHANVPNLPDVYGALLRAPWHLARAYCTILSAFPKGHKERDKWIHAFFEDGVADSCFNAKWKSIEEFNAQLAKLGTIRDRLGLIQQEDQKRFGEIYDLQIPEEEQDRKEVALLFEIARARYPTGRDKDGKWRAITETDCKKFVADPGQEI